MEPVDLLALNKMSNSNGGRNAFMGRQTLLPRCTKKWRIVKGPTFPRICAAPADKLPWEMARRHGFEHADKRISDRIPVEFAIDAETSHKYAQNFSVEAVAWSVDTYPDLYALAWAIFGYCSSDHSAADDFAGHVALRGYFRAVSESEHTPEQLRGADYKECIIIYNPSKLCGWLGEVTQVQELPTCGVVKDFSVLYWIADKFSGGFVETHAPDGVTRWGRLTGGGTGSWVLCDAAKFNDQNWKYRSRGDNAPLSMFGVRYVNKENAWRYELVGDAFLCSDGTVLHSYYFSRKEWGEDSNIPKEWKEGYYHNRLYPPDSLMIPKHITDSFEREMPAWFYKDDVERKAKTQKAVR